MPARGSAKRRHAARRLIALVLTALAACPGVSALAQPTATDGWAAMQDGAVVLVRHATAPGGGDPPGFRLGDCGPAAKERALRAGAHLWRGDGHALVTATPAGVNGLHDMGGNAWEWVDEPAGLGGNALRRTRGGSWWYGQEQMQADHLQSKPGHTTVVYIGFRCVRAP